MATQIQSFDPKVVSIDAFRALAAATTTQRNLETFAHIEALRRLPPGWDGYQGVKPSEASIEQATAFVANLPADLRMPEVEPAGDGEINLVWRSDAAYLEVGFTGAPHFSFFGKMRVGAPNRQFGDVPCNANRLPVALHALMRFFVDDVRVRGDGSERRSTVAWAC